MMEEKRNKNLSDDQLKEMIRTTKGKAPQNLQYRIMQQIETERACTPSETTGKKESGNVIKDFGAIFGTMYAVLAVMIVIAYILFGSEYLLTPIFIGKSVLVASIFSLLWLISRLDLFFARKKKTEQSSSEV